MRMLHKAVKVEPSRLPHIWWKQGNPLLLCVWQNWLKQRWKVSRMEVNVKGDVDVKGVATDFMMVWMQ